MTAWADEIERDGFDRAVWGDSMPWDDGIAHCLERIVPVVHRAPFGEVVDHGCGVGRLTSAIATAAHRLTWGVDPEPLMVAEAEKRYARELGRTHFGFVLDDGDWLPKCTTVVSVLVMQHVEDKLAMMLRWRNALKDEGRVIAQVAIGYDADALSWQLASDDAVGYLFDRGGFDVVEINEDPVFPTWRWVEAVKA